MTYWGSFGQQQQPRRPSYGSYSAMGQQQPQASGGNWQSAMAGGQPSGATAMRSQMQQQGGQQSPRWQTGQGAGQQAIRPYGMQSGNMDGIAPPSGISRPWDRSGYGQQRTLSGRMQDLEGQITGLSQYGALRQEEQRIQQQIEQMRQSGATPQQLEAFSQQAQQRMAPLEAQYNQASAPLQQQYNILGQQYQQQGGAGYPQPYGIRNAPSQRVYAEQRGYMPDPGSGYRPGQGGGYSGGYGGQQNIRPYNPADYRLPDGGVVKTDERDRYARLYGYNVEGSPTYDRQRFEAEQLGRINGADTLQGRAQTLTERLGLGQLDISQRQQRLQEMVQTGQLSIEQARQALAERSNEQQYGLQGQRLGLDTELGRGDLDLRRMQNAQDWQYKMAQTAANPASAATMAALSGNVPWLRPQQPQIAARPGSPLSSAQTGVLSGREMNYNTYGRLNPSEQAAYGSYARAAYGVDPSDLELQMRQYAPGQGSGMQTARWR